MAVDMAAALGGPVTAQAVQTDGNTNQAGSINQSSITPPPSGKMSDVSAWALSIGLGSSLADSLLEKCPELASSEEDKAKLSSLMQGMMNQVTKSLGNAADFLKELDDDEDKCAATAIYAQ